MSPSPLNAWAAALSVRFNLTGSNCCAISVNFSKRVLISVVSDRALITVCGVTAWDTGCAGVVRDTYLSPKTVVARMSASTLAGINGTYFGFTLSSNLAAGLPSRSTSEMVPTRPISTPL